MSASQPTESTKADLAEIVRDFVVTRFPALPDELALDDPLLESGAVDSLGMLDIVMFVEERFDIFIDDHELVGEHFESVEAIARLVASKTS